MTLLTRDLARQLAKPSILRIENVPGLDCDVCVRPITSSEALEYSTNIEDTPEGGLIAMVDLVILAVVDEAGERLFTTEDRGTVSQWSFRALNFLSHEIAVLNGLSVEDAEKN